MGHHDRDLFTRKWNKPEETNVVSENPRMQVISPQKKLYDIQQIIDSLPEKHLNTVELSEAIQKILNGE